jgi:hypothetical protein
MNEDVLTAAVRLNEAVTLLDGVPNASAGDVLITEDKRLMCAYDDAWL